MNPEVKKKWVAELRSGNYNQTQGRLKNDCGYCVLGVLCDIYAKENGLAWEKFGENIYRIPSVQTSGAYPSSKVIKWAELNIDDLMLNLPKTDGSTELVPHSIVGLNDIKKADFSKFADLIEEQL